MSHHRGFDVIDRVEIPLAHVDDACLDGLPLVSVGGLEPALEFSPFLEDVCDRATHDGTLSGLYGPQVLGHGGIPGRPSRRGNGSLAPL
ncbi:MAG: hypothetical protein ACAI18_03185, partial [Gemmatimonadales bacterium]